LVVQSADGVIIKNVPCPKTVEEVMAIIKGLK